LQLKRPEEFKRIWRSAFPAIKANQRAEKSHHYAFSFEPTSDVASCRGSFADAKSVLRHMKNVDRPFRAGLDGPSELLRLEVHAPASEIEKLKPALAPLGCKFFTTEWGFRNAVGDQAQRVVSRFPEVKVCNRNMVSLDALGSSASSSSSSSASPDALQHGGRDSLNLAVSLAAPQIDYEAEPKLMSLGKSDGHNCIPLSKLLLYLGWGDAVEDEYGCKVDDGVASRSMARSPTARSWGQSCQYSVPSSSVAKKGPVEGGALCNIQ
jgi:hypothetical protein